MTPFGVLLRLSGLSQSEAGTLLGVSVSQVEKMTSGKRTAPPGIMSELRDLIAQQRAASDRALDVIEETRPEGIELGYPADDHEARQLGFPTVSAWGAMAARVIAEVDAPVKLVPRGSTPATAAAIDARAEKR